MWGLLFLASLLMAPSLGCIPCAKRGMEAMDKWKTIIQKKVVEPAIEGYEAIKDVANSKEKKILEFLEAVGTLDEEAISAIVSAYETAVNVIEKTDSTGMHLLTEMENTFNHLKEVMEVIVEEAEKRRCPNKQDIANCGLMVQTYTMCKTCDKVKTICAGGSPQNQEFFDMCSCICTNVQCFDLKTGSECTPCGDHTSHLADAIDCGERNITIVENKDLDLSCNSDWFAKLEDGHKNVFSKTTYPVPRITNDTDIELKEIGTYESGQYTCTTLLSSGVPISKITYNVKVLSGSEEVTQVHEPMPALPTKEETPTPDVPRDITSPEPILQDARPSIRQIVSYVALASNLTLFFGIILLAYVTRRSKNPEVVEQV